MNSKNGLMLAALFLSIPIIGINEKIIGNEDYDMTYKTSFTVYSLITPKSSMSHTKGTLLPMASKIDAGVYQHYKGGYYLVFLVTTDTETEEEMVVYQSLSGDFRVWSRPLEMFVSTVEYNDVLQPRFKKIADSSEAEKFLIEAQIG